MKQRFSSLDVKVIAKELSSALTGLRVSNIYDLSSRIFLFKFAKPGTKEQLLVDSGFRCHLTNFGRTTLGAPSVFVSKLRKYLKSRRVTSVSQIGTDRVIEVAFSDGQYRLFLEFFAAGNIVVTDKDYNILIVLRNVSEGRDDVDVRTGIVYPITAKQQYSGIKPLSEQLVTDSLREWIEKFDSTAKPTSKKGGKGNLNDMKRALTNNFPHFPNHLLDDSFQKAGFDATLKPADILKDAQLLSDLMRVLQLSDKTLQRLGEDIKTTGYIIAKSKGTENESQESDSTSVKIVPTRDKLLYEDFHPFRPAQFEGKPGYHILTIEGFNKTSDEFYSSIETQKLETRLAEKEDTAKRKIESARQIHDKRLGALQQVQELHIQKAEAIEANSYRVEEAIAAVNGLIGQGMDWMDIAKLIENEQSRDNQVAQLIKLPLKLYENTVTLLLSGATFQDDRDGGDDSDEFGESDEEEVEEVSQPVAGEKKLAIDVDLALSSWANARQYYDQKKTAARKEEKTLQASEKALKSAEHKINADLKQGLKSEKDGLRPSRQQFWFEKFWYFISSDGYLVIGGKDVQQNEILYRRYLKRGDLYVHADLQGAASVIVKNDISTPDAPIPPSTLSQAGALSVCTSSAWDSKAVMAAWWVHADQVSKTAPTGEYLTTGCFIIKGEKNFLPPAQLLYGFAVAFQISDESKANHRRHRAPGLDEPGHAHVSEVVTESTEISLSDDASTSPIESEGDDENDDDDVITELDQKNEHESNVHSNDEAKAQEHDELNHVADDDSDAESESSVQASNPLQTSKAFAMSKGNPTPEIEETQAPEEEAELVESAPATETNAVPSRPKESNLPPSEAPSSSTPSTSTPHNTPTPRGKSTKASKRALAKYAQQDDEERALALQLLGSTKAQEKKAAAAIAQAAKTAKIAADKERRKAQHERAAREEGKRQERLEKGVEDGNEEERDDEALRLLLAEEAKQTANLDSLIPNPMPNDVILAAIPMVAPWASLGRYKYKIKLQPGALKKGKALKEILGKWGELGKVVQEKSGAGGGSLKGHQQALAKLVDREGRDREKFWPRELECLRAWRVEEIVGVVPVGRVRVVAGPGLRSGSGGRGGGGGKGGKGKGKAGGSGGGGKGGKKK